ncbi:MAG: tRNA (cytidine(34)-2'-O)-methyltransferase [Limisphaerales bacterium]
MNIVLLEPEIPPNTGNVARLCAATGTRLHLIRPLGFRLGDRELKRAGMDYWQQVDWRLWEDWASFTAEQPSMARFWLVEQGGATRYDKATFGPEDYLVFGRETAGLPRALLESHTDSWLRIPMFNAEARSLNLANCVSLVLYEALRQQGFAEELGE